MTARKFRGNSAIDALVDDVAVEHNYQVFVYGTLKPLRDIRSNHNFAPVLAKYTETWECGTSHNHTMFDFGGFPAAAHNRDLNKEYPMFKTSVTHGYVVYIHPHLWAEARMHMDRLEGHPHFYQRVSTPIEITTGANTGKVVNCWMYQMPVHHIDLEFPLLEGIW